MPRRRNVAAERLSGKKALSDLREVKCREWAEDPNIVQCLRSILAWSEELTCNQTAVNENVYDWVNNIVWYVKMMDIDPVLLRKVSAPKKGSK